MAITLSQINDLVADETLGLGGRQEAGPPQEDFVPLSMDALAMVRYYIGACRDGGGGVPTSLTHKRWGLQTSSRGCILPGGRLAQALDRIGNMMGTGRKSAMLRFL